MTYRILVVDDERLERVALETLVDWPAIGVELVGSAANGLEGLSKIEELHPDIVITDIKMPGMDGIGLIRATKDRNADICFVVLSGHGEYEYTSQAMELGVRHYILKPVDREKIVQVVRKAAADVEADHRARRMRLQREEAIEKLLPDAKRAFFARALSDSDLPDAEYEFYISRCNLTGDLSLLTAKFFGVVGDAERSATEHFVRSLFDAEQMGLETADRNGLYIVLRGARFAGVQSAVRRLEAFFRRLETGDIGFALSPVAGFRDVREVRLRNDRLLLLQDSALHGRLMTGADQVIPADEFERLVDLRAWAAITDLIGVYRYACRFCAILDASGYTAKVDSAVLSALVRSIGDDVEVPLEIDRNSVFDILERLWEKEHTGDEADRTEQDKRFTALAKEIFIRLPDQSLTVKMIANDIAFMNEDHFARVFQRQAGVRIKDFLLAERMELAVAILAVDAGIAVTNLSILAGYPEDGQYFSKVFKSYFAMTISQYRHAHAAPTETGSG